MMDRLHTILEGLSLLLLGVFMYAFSLSESYWMLLSPKFQPLTAASGFILFVVGGAMTIRKPPHGVRRWASIVTLCAFLALAAWAVLDSQHSLVPDKPQGHTPMSLELPEPEAFDPRLSIDGTEYVRITIPELFMLTESETMEFPRQVVMRGMVARNEELDRRGMIAVFRVNVFCCLADAVAPGFLVSVDNPDSYPQGTWVRVAGEVVETRTDNTTGETSLPGMLMSFLSTKYEIKGRQVQDTDPPDIPFTFELRHKEPFGY